MAGWRGARKISSACEWVNGAAHNAQGKWNGFVAWNDLGEMSCSNGCAEGELDMEDVLRVVVATV